MAYISINLLFGIRISIPCSTFVCRFNSDMLCESYVKVYMWVYCMGPSVWSPPLGRPCVWKTCTWCSYIINTVFDVYDNKVHQNVSLHISFLISFGSLIGCIILLPQEVVLWLVTKILFPAEVVLCSQSEYQRIWEMLSFWWTLLHRTLQCLSAILLVLLHFRKDFYLIHNVLKLIRVLAFNIQARF